MSWQNISLKSKMPRKISQQPLVSGGLHKNIIFQCDFDDNMSVIHVFIKQVIRAAKKAPTSPPPSPHSAVQAGGGVVVVLFSPKQ
jgi:hypothetical protein